MNPKRQRKPDPAPTERQLRYLAALGYEGKAPVTRADASWQISHLKAKAKDFGTLDLSDARRPTHMPATARQIQMLRQLGYEGPEDISSTDAVRLHSYLRQTISSG